MSKRHHQNRVHSSHHADTSMSVGPEIPNQMQGQTGALESEDQFSPSYEDIQVRAYRIHEEKGGSDLENWLEAEQVLRDEHRG